MGFPMTTAPSRHPTKGRVQPCAERVRPCYPLDGRNASGWRSNCGSALSRRAPCRTFARTTVVGTKPATKREEASLEVRSKGAKSPVGRPLRCQVSSRSRHAVLTRCCRQGKTFGTSGARSRGGSPCGPEVAPRPDPDRGDSEIRHPAVDHTEARNTPDLGTLASVFSPTTWRNRFCRGVAQHGWGSDPG
jgi:hypothetical protein